MQSKGRQGIILMIFIKICSSSEHVAAILDALEGGDKKESNFYPGLNFYPYKISDAEKNAIFVGRR